MDELVHQIHTALRSMWHRRWIGLAVAWLVAIIGVTVAMRIPDRYEASARVYVDTQTLLRPLMEGLSIQPNLEQQVILLSRTLISRPNLEKLVRMADLDLGASTKPEQDRLLDDLGKDLRIASTSRDNLFTLSYQNSDQDKAKRVIQSLVSIFVESSLGASRKDTDSARVFLDEQIRNYEAKLEEAESRLKAFRLRNLEMQTSDGVDSAGRLAGLSQQLRDARLQLREAENSRDAVKTQIEAEKKKPASASSGSLLDSPDMAMQASTPELDARIATQRQNLDGLLQRYTDQHPDVLSARRLIADLEKQKTKEVAELQAKLASAPDGRGKGESPVVQQLNSMMAATEVQIAALRARVDEFNGRFEAAKVAMRTAPQLEAEAAQLNRDYEITKRNYDNLVSRRQSAVMSGDLESASGVADFKLIDPPRVSPKPVSPNRLLLLPIALVAALGAGLFTAFAISQIRPVFMDVTELRTKTGLPLLGVVSVVMGDNDRRQERADRLRFFAASGSLLVLFALGISAMAVLLGR